MQDRYLLRGKSFGDGKFIIGYLYRGDRIESHVANGINSHWSREDVDPKTIGQ